MDSADLRSKGGIGNLTLLCQRWADGWASGMHSSPFLTNPRLSGLGASGDASSPNSKPRFVAHPIWQLGLDGACIKHMPEAEEVSRARQSTVYMVDVPGEIDYHQRDGGGDDLG
jgi:hypothetical protein